MSKKIFISLSKYGPHETDPLIQFKENGYEIAFNQLGRKLNAEEVVTYAKDCVGIIAGLEPLNKPVLDQLSHLRIISRSGIGVDNIDMEAARKRNIKVFITAEAPVASVVELTLALAFDLCRKVTQADKLIRQHQWTRLKGEQLSGKTVGVVGLGRIGKRVAQAFQSLGCAVIGFDPAPDLNWSSNHDVRLSSLEDVLRRSDIITLHTPRMEGGRPLMGKREMAFMKKESYLINMARGGVVDEAALVEALKSKKIGGAGLDVFESEPYHGPLADMANVVLTAHMGSHTRQARAQMEQDAVKNLAEGLLSLKSV